MGFLPAYSKTTKKLVAEGFSLGYCTQASVVHLLRIQLHSILREVEPFLDNRCQLSNPPPLLSYKFIFLVVGYKGLQVRDIHPHMYYTAYKNQNKHYWLSKQKGILVSYIAATISGVFQICKCNFSCPGVTISLTLNPGFQQDCTKEMVRNVQRSYQEHSECEWRG